MKQINKQIIAAGIRQKIAEQELENHKKQIEQTRKVDEFMHDKYTNRELYSWMLGELSAVHFQCYQLAYDLAKRDDRACREELGIDDASWVQYGHWDSLKKGLLAGEKLALDLKRLEVAYLEQNKRELELTDHISLLQLDPLALVRLKETGECDVSLPEALFDLHCPGGHYFRRIKTVGLTIPCIVGPYSGVYCTLTLKKHCYRKTPIVGSGGYPRKTDEDGQPADDGRFVDGLPGAMQSIVTSSAQNDSGLFELNFHDERYLPFEGAGAISTWHLELPKFRQFDYDTISDVIIHLRYTARQDGALKDKVSAEVNKQLTTLMQLAEGRSGLARLFSVRHEFPNEWYRFQEDTSEAGPVLNLQIAHERFPIFCQGYKVKVTRIDAMAMRRTPRRDRRVEPGRCPDDDERLEEVRRFRDQQHGVRPRGRRRRHPAREARDRHPDERGLAPGRHRRDIPDLSLHGRHEKLSGLKAKAGDAQASGR